MAKKSSQPIPSDESPGAVEHQDVGVVVIGRNEGERLMLCLDSLQRAGAPLTHLVYVDSGSTDGSVERVRARGVDAITIDKPFTARRRAVGSPTRRGAPSPCRCSL